MICVSKTPIPHTMHQSRHTGRARRAARPRRGAGAAEPTPGWKGHASLPTALLNPRVPSVPATLHLGLNDYFTAAALMGLLASMAEEPNQQWACDWSLKMGERMAKAARKRQRK